jgi:caa(3)-type oxidase subunit IV
VALEERQGIGPADVHASAGAHGAGHPSPKEYVRIGLILFVLTALEITASYTHVSGGILIPTLFVLAIVKFALVVLWFMHLKFDDRRFARFFVMGLAGASILYLIVLISFKVFL